MATVSNVTCTYNDELFVAFGGTENDCCHRSKNGFHLNALQHADGLGYIFHTLYPQFLSAGGSESHWSMMTCKNPIAVLDV